MKEKIEITVLLLLLIRPCNSFSYLTPKKIEVSGANKLRPAETRDEKEQNLSLTNPLT